MASPLDSGKYIAEGALIAITASACVIPDAWYLAGEAYKMQCDPGAIYDAGQAWLDSAGQIGEALNAAMDTNNAIAGTGWEGQDADAFSEKVADYIRELMVAQVFAYTVGIALIVAAIASFISILVLAAMAVGLTVWAGVILAAMASVVGFLGPVEVLEVDASLYAVECELGLDELDVATKATDGVLAGGIGAFLTGDAGVQLAMGDTAVLGDLVQAGVDGIGTITAGLTAALYQNVMGRGIGKTVGRGPLNTLLTAVGLGDTLYGSSVVDRGTQGIDPVQH
ncbi:MAG TPA: hypothetical protein VGN18_20380 [Jatrophihabitans sp.]|jgi:hypothetical protein|uniref:hypothetical protein n=1 Tax=Jatrophihabitans sp. TaxID=1932789 RepID=UPI002E00E970|nr:hypothetical protein [Jatrophihabitans sp.]